MTMSQTRPTGRATRDSQAPALLDARLFVPHERWGWEYLDVRRQMLDVGPEPQWIEPPQPVDLMDDLADQQAQARARLPKRACITGVAVLALAILGSASFALLALLGGGAWAYLPVMLPARRLKQAEQAWQAHCAAEHAAFQAHFQQRSRWIAQRQRDEEVRLANSARFRDVALESRPARVDVFGDTSDGWASMLTTAGCSLLRSGSAVLLLDLTGEHVAGGLVDMARGKGFETTHLTLPDEAARVRLLDDLTAHEIGEVLAEVARGPWPTGGDDRGLHAELVRAVAERLDGPVTVQRLGAGLRVLRRVHSTAHEQLLSRAELARLADHVDSVGQTERVQFELQALTTVVDSLALGDHVDGSAAPLCGRSHLRVLTTDADPRRKKALDRLLFHRVLCDLSAGGLAPGTVLVVAGADSLDLESLETMARHARRGRVRLVLFMEKLRDELKHLLGRSDSATIFMRLGNAGEAQLAAEHIGRGHKLVLSQLTTQLGDSFTQGDSEAVGTQDGESFGTTTTEGTSTSTGTSSGESVQRDPDRLGLSLEKGQRTSNSGNTSGVSSSTSRAESINRSRSRTWQTTKNYSEQVSRSTGETYGRTYDFHTEPTCFQDLAPTAFVLVEPGASGRRVVMGDCNPGISMLARSALPPATP